MDKSLKKVFQIKTILLELIKSHLCCIYLYSISLKFYYGVNLNLHHLILYFKPLGYTFIGINL